MDRAADRSVRPVARCDRDGDISGDMRQESLVFGGERGDAGGDWLSGVVESGGHTGLEGGLCGCFSYPQFGYGTIVQGGHER